MPRLSDLAAERARGRSPELPVFVSDLGEPLASNLAGAGAWVIAVFGEAKDWDWRAVSGLDVILALRRPTSEWSRDLARAVRDARPRRLQCIDWTAPPGERLSATMPVCA